MAERSSRHYLSEWQYDAVADNGARSIGSHAREKQASLAFRSVDRIRQRYDVFARDIELDLEAEVQRHLEDTQAVAAATSTAPTTSARPQSAGRIRQGSTTLALAQERSTGVMASMPKSIHDTHAAGHAVRHVTAPVSPSRASSPPRQRTRPRSALPQRPPVQNDHDDLEAYRPSAQPRQRPQSAKPMSRSSGQPVIDKEELVAGMPASMQQSKWTDMMYRGPAFKQETLQRLEAETLELLQSVFNSTASTRKEATKSKPRPHPQTTSRPCSASHRDGVARGSAMQAVRSGSTARERPTSAGPRRATPAGNTRVSEMPLPISPQKALREKTLRRHLLLRRQAAAASKQKKADKTQARATTDPVVSQEVDQVTLRTKTTKPHARERAGKTTKISLEIKDENLDISQLLELLDEKTQSMANDIARSEQRRRQQAARLTNQSPSDHARSRSPSPDTYKPPVRVKPVTALATSKSTPEQQAGWTAKTITKTQRPHQKQRLPTNLKMTAVTPVDLSTSDKPGKIPTTQLPSTGEPSTAQVSILPQPEDTQDADEQDCDTMVFDIEVAMPQQPTPTPPFIPRLDLTKLPRFVSNDDDNIVMAALACLANETTTLPRFHSSGQLIENIELVVSPSTAMGPSIEHLLRGDHDDSSVDTPRIRSGRRSSVTSSTMAQWTQRSLSNISSMHSSLRGFNGQELDLAASEEPQDIDTTQQDNPDCEDVHAASGPWCDNEEKRSGLAVLMSVTEPAALSSRSELAVNLDVVQATASPLTSPLETHANVDTGNVEPQTIPHATDVAAATLGIDNMTDPLHTSASNGASILNMAEIGDSSSTTHEDVSFATRANESTETLPIDTGSSDHRHFQDKLFATEINHPFVDPVQADDKIPANDPIESPQPMTEAPNKRTKSKKKKHRHYDHEKPMAHDVASSLLVSTTEHPSTTSDQVSPVIPPPSGGLMHESSINPAVRRSTLARLRSVVRVVQACGKWVVRSKHCPRLAQSHHEELQRNEEPSSTAATSSAEILRHHAAQKIQAQYLRYVSRTMLLDQLKFFLKQHHRQSRKERRASMKRMALGATHDGTTQAVNASADFAPRETIPETEETIAMDSTTASSMSETIAGTVANETSDQALPVTIVTDNFDANENNGADVLLTRVTTEQTSIQQESTSVCEVVAVESQEPLHTANDEQKHHTDGQEMVTADPVEDYCHGYDGYDGQDQEHLEERHDGNPSATEAGADHHEYADDENVVALGSPSHAYEISLNPDWLPEQGDECDGPELDDIDAEHSEHSHANIALGSWWMALAELGDDDEATNGADAAMEVQEHDAIGGIAAQETYSEEIETWERYVDSTSGTHYYYNRKRATSVWEVPQNAIVVDPSSVSSAVDREANDQTSMMSMATADASEHADKDAIASWDATLATATLLESMGGWDRYIPSNSSNVFYHHVERHEFAETEPAEFTDAKAFLLMDDDGSEQLEGQRDDPLGDTVDHSTSRWHEVTAEQGEWELRRENSLSAEKRGAWQAFVDERSGHTFYYNASTGENTWERPPEFDQARNTSATAHTTPQGSAWTMYIDPASSLPYYYNALTGECMWEKPADFDELFADFSARPPDGEAVDADGEDEYVINIGEKASDMAWP